MWARQVEAAQTAGGNGPSFFKSTVSSGCPQLRPHLATQAAYGGVKRTSAHHGPGGTVAVACELGAGVAPQLLPIMTTTVYGEDYARRVTVVSADVVEHMIAVSLRHHVAPFSGGSSVQTGRYLLRQLGHGRGETCFGARRGMHMGEGYRFFCFHVLGRVSSPVRCYTPHL